MAAYEPFLAQQSWQSQNGFPPRTPEIPSVHHEASAGGLPEVAQGEGAPCGMKRGTRRGDVKFAHGSFRR